MLRHESRLYGPAGSLRRAGAASASARHMEAGNLVEIASASSTWQPITARIAFFVAGLTCFSYPR